MILINGANALTSPFTLDVSRKAGLRPTLVTTAVVIVCSIASVVFALALWRWRRWGFYGFIGVAVIAFLNNLAVGVSPIHCLVGLIGIGVLFWVLNIGGENKAWPRLK